MKNQRIYILFIDDNDERIGLARRAFESQSEVFELRVARSLGEARKYLSDKTSDIIFTSLQLPDGQGTDLIGGGENGPLLPVVILTPGGNDHIAVEVLKLGALDCVIQSEENLAYLPHLARRALREWETIEKRRRAERALAESEERFRAFMNHMPAVAFIKDAEGRYIYGNSAWAAQFGKPAESLLGKTDFDLWPQSDAEMFRTGDQVVRDTGTITEVLESHLDENGKLHWWTVLKFQLPAGLLGGIVIDMTEQKQMEEQYRQAQKMEAIGQLAGGIAHDFNNLLTAINGFATIVLNNLDPADPNRRYMESILDAGKRAADLTHQLLAFSRKQILQPQLLDLNHVVARMQNLLRRLIGEHIELKLQLADEPLPLVADPNQLEQVILNLAINARDAMPDGGVLTLTTAQRDLTDKDLEQHTAQLPGKYVMLVVNDTGTGIHPDHLQRIFEPFFTTKEVGKGTGLGLATVYGVVKQTRGHIEVDSTLGQGCTFRIYFPLDQSAAAPTQDRNSAAELPCGTETILLVEDEANVRSLAERILQSCGYHVLVAANGKEALQICATYNGTIHLLATDIVMPQLGGKELADIVSRQRPEMKILFISGYPNQELSAEYLEKLLDKPFTPLELTQRVRQVLDEK